MIEIIVNWTVSILGKSGYLGIVIMMALESACIPIPSEAILPFGGYLASTANPYNQLNLFGVIIWGTVGGTFGSLFAYCIGFWGGIPFVNKYSKMLRLSDSHLKKSKKLFEKHGEKIVFYSRLIPIIRTFISLPAGIAKINIKVFIIYTFLGSLLWSILLVYTGYRLGQNWGNVRSWVHILDYAVIILGCGFFAYCIYKNKKKVNERG